MDEYQKSYKIAAFNWYNLGVVGGIAIGLSFACILLIGIEAESLRQFLKDWKELIGALLALVGALIAAWIVVRQIDVARLQEDERRARKHYAARAAMPVALTELAEYATGAVEALRSLLNNPAGSNPSALQLPELPTTALDTLQTCIESAPPAVMGEIARILEEFQIVSARLRTLKYGGGIQTGRISTTQSLEGELADVIEFYARVNQMFSYARRREPDLNVRITTDELVRAAFFMNFNSETLNQRLRARKLE